MFRVSIKVSEIERVILKFYHATNVGFNNGWVNLIIDYVSSVSYSVKVNRHTSEAIRPTRGLRQGDLLSPYLFVLCAQGLSAIINNCAANGLIQGVRNASGSPTTTYLFFVDDNLIFFKTDNLNCSAVKNSLKGYERASGQQVNYDKSAITFSKITPREISSISKSSFSFCSARVMICIWDFLLSQFAVRGFNSATSGTV